MRSCSAQELVGGCCLRVLLPEHCECQGVHEAPRELMADGPEDQQPLVAGCMQACVLGWPAQCWQPAHARIIHATACQRGGRGRVG